MLGRLQEQNSPCPHGAHSLTGVERPSSNQMKTPQPERANERDDRALGSGVKVIVQIARSRKASQHDTEAELSITREQAWEE